MFGAVVPLAAAYNGDAAAKYATDHRSDKEVFPGHDCTYFASCALYAGGWAMINPWYDKYNYANVDYWYYVINKRPFYSNTWTVADSLYRFMSRHQERAIALSTRAPYCKYKRGDLILIDYERDGRWDHTMVVTGISSGYKDLQITQHGDNAPVKMLSDIKNTYSSANFIGWSIR